jgi:phage shock protein PspC (stress-responsive transcriptional regulator)
MATLSEQLQQLDDLHRRGVLSDAEFAQAKARTLSQTGDGSGLGFLRQLRRHPVDRWLGGVCGGVAEATDTAAWIWRLGFVLLLMCAGTGVVFYALLWFFIPLGHLRLPAPAGGVPHSG